MITCDRNDNEDNDEDDNEDNNEDDHKDYDDDEEDEDHKDDDNDDDDEEDDHHHKAEGGSHLTSICHSHRLMSAYSITCRCRQSSCIFFIFFRPLQTTLGSTCTNR